MDLKRDQTKWKVEVEESWLAEQPKWRTEKWRYYEIRGKYGMIYPYSATQLAAYVTTKRIANKLLRREGYIKKQDGDTETVVWFPMTDLDFVARALKASRRRFLSPAAKKLAIQRLKLARAVWEQKKSHSDARQ